MVLNCSIISGVMLKFPGSLGTSLVADSCPGAMTIPCWFKNATMTLTMSWSTLLLTSMLPLIPTVTMFPMLLSWIEVGAATAAATKARRMTAANFILIFGELYRTFSSFRSKSTEENSWFTQNLYKTIFQSDTIANFLSVNLETSSECESIPAYIHFWKWKFVIHLVSF